MESIFEQYGWEVTKWEQLHQGLINSTYMVETTTGNYVLQTVNHAIFKDPAAIDHNINTIGTYIQKNEPNYLFTHLVPTKMGETLLEWEGKYYRAFHKIDAYALSVLENPNQAKEAAAQFGKFSRVLKGLDRGSLKITLPNFHNLSLRYQQFEDALQHGNPQRIAATKEVIAYLKSQKWIVDKYEKFIADPSAKLRVTHHDTKISNVLFKNENGVERAICVIDLDTVMPGYFISDIGDMFRTCLCSVSEEESNLDLLKVDPLKWNAIQSGYLGQMENELSSFELDHVFFGGQFMIYMQALRFLTDHLNQDIYYGAKYEGQNKVRALNQIRLLEIYNELER